MKVHRIITTIEVENDNSITSVELTKLNLTNADIPLAITNLTTNGGADDIKQVHDITSECRLVIDSKLKGIAGVVNASLNSHQYEESAHDINTNIAIDDNKTSYVSELRTTSSCETR